MLLSIAQANDRIARGEPLVIAGSRAALAGLSPGNWIAGTIPYFMTPEGGRCDRHQVYVEEFTLTVSRSQIRVYPPAQLSSIATDGYDNGFSYVIVPADSEAHLQYATNAPGYPEIFLKPVIGWISGVHLDDLGRDTAAVVDGRTGTFHANAAVVLHVELPRAVQPIVKTINLFRAGAGAPLRFPEVGFSAETALVHGRPVNVVDLMRQRQWDPSLPLVADYGGTSVNVSIKQVDSVARRVSFYAPVFPDVDYYHAEPVPDYVVAFARQVPPGAKPIVACNCILNYLYGKLEGRRTGNFVGPVTFGEIAHQLVNQTLVYLADANAPE